MLADLLDKHRHVADGCPHAMKKSKPVSIRVNDASVPDGNILVPIPTKELRFVSVEILSVAFEHAVSAAQCTFDRRSVFHELPHQIICRNLTKA